MIMELRQRFGVSQPRACRLVGQHRSAQRRPARAPRSAEEAQLLPGTEAGIGRRLACLFDLRGVALGGLLVITPPARLALSGRRRLLEGLQRAPCSVRTFILRS